MDGAYLVGIARCIGPTPPEAAAIREIVLQRREAARPALNFEQDLIAVAQNFNNEKIAQLATVPPEAYLRLFESRTGEDLKRVVFSALGFRQIGNASPDMKTITAKAEDALRTIGKRSALQAIRLQKFGVNLSVTSDEDEEERGA
jgi:hypothetical protein